MQKEEILRLTEEFVRKTLESEGTGHDWQHIDRVRKNALAIGRAENADLYVIELAALLHDISDWKFHEPGSTPTAVRFLKSLDLDEDTISHVEYIIDNVSFKGKDAVKELNTLEAKVVQDADRLDALGAIGIARCFAYGGSKGTLLHDPSQKPFRFDRESYIQAAREGKGTSVNHFYEKLLLLRDLMNTQAGRKMAKQRHEYMEKFLQQFYAEWDGEK